QIPGCPYRPFVGNMVEARKSQAMTNCLKWMKKYNSKIIRFYFYGGEERLLVADPDIFRQVLVTNSKNYVRHQQATRLSDLIGALPLFSLSGEEHHVIRRLTNPAFSLKVLHGMIPVFKERVEKLVDIWSKLINESSTESNTKSRAQSSTESRAQSSTESNTEHSTQSNTECSTEKQEYKFAEVDVQFYLMSVTLDIICQVGFDYELGSLENPGSAGEGKIKSLLNNIRPGLLDFLPFSDKIPTKTNKRFWRDSAFTKEFTEKLIEKRKERVSGSEKRDILSILMDARDEKGSGLSDRQLIGHVFGFLVAGFETTNTSTTWILLKLAENPRVQDKLRKEVTSILEECNYDITHDCLDRMKYLTCVIKETFRLLPPLTCLFKRAIADDIFKGYFIPKGTVVGLHIGALHRLNWEEGDEFIPERFLDSGSVDGTLYVPFGFGPYMCIGHKFSMLEMKTILSILISKFVFDLVPDREYRRVQGVTMRPDPAVHLRISSL
ncbi:hypothetical protein FSP39_016384, partial [Pinctada imbricata]